MKITFTLTAAEARRGFWLPWCRRASLGLLPLGAVPVVFWLAASAGGQARVFVLIVGAVTAVAPCAALALFAQDWARQARAERRVRVAEVNRFDFFWSASGGRGYYTHWSRFAEVAAAGDHFAFILESGHRFVVPKSAFDDAVHAQAFLTLARRHWEAARLNAACASPAFPEQGVWPPPPRVGR